MKTITTKITFILTLCLIGSFPLRGQIADKGEAPESAPIIESGRLVGTITNTTATLLHNIMVPAFSKGTRQTNFTMEGNMVGHYTVGPNLDARGPQNGSQVKILKVVDDVATVVAGKGITTPAVEIHYSSLQEFTNMPHLTDACAQWINPAQTWASLEDRMVRFVKNYESITFIDPKKAMSQEVKDHCQKLLANYHNIPWRHSDVVDEYQKLNVPITTEVGTGDNSSVVAVANALNYLYTKAETNPTLVSKSFLMWAHDSYPLNDSELNSAWHPSDYVDPKKMEEGRRLDQADRCMPNIIAIGVVSGNEHRIDLGRLLKGVQRFGVALEPEQPSTNRWTVPTPETLATSTDRIKKRPIVVRCFADWNGNQPGNEIKDSVFFKNGSEDRLNYLNKEAQYRARYYAFITKEVASGHPVIVTYLKKLTPSGKEYIKRSYVITGSGNPTHHQSLQFLTPSGKFESYNFSGDNSNPFGEVINPNPANLHASLLSGEPWCTPLEQINKQVSTNVVYGNHDQYKAGNIGAGRFEVYSLGFE